jgi:hypothetical protein
LHRSWPQAEYASCSDSSIGWCSVKNLTLLFKTAAPCVKVDPMFAVNTSPCEDHNGIFLALYLFPMAGNPLGAKRFARHIVDRTPFRGTRQAPRICHRTRWLSGKMRKIALFRALQKFILVSMHCLETETALTKSTNGCGSVPVSCLEVDLCYHSVCYILIRQKGSVGTCLFAL